MASLASMVASFASSTHADAFGTNDNDDPETAANTAAGDDLDHRWPERAELATRRAQVLALLEGEAVSGGSSGGGRLPPAVADKCLRQHGGDVTKAASVGRGLLRFRRAIGWAAVLRGPGGSSGVDSGGFCSSGGGGDADANGVDVDRVDGGALRSGLHWLLRDAAGRAVVVYRFDALDPALASVPRFQQMAM
jgi:hypothetical protein